MTQLPEMAFLDEPRTESELKNQFFGSIVGILSEMLGGAPVSKLFIASGTVVPTAASHTLDTEGGTPSDDLATVDMANHSEGRILTLSCADNSRSITIKHGMGGSGQVILNDFQDLVLSDTRDRLFLQRVGTHWEELFRAGPSFKEEPIDPDTVLAPGGVLPALDGSQLTGLPSQDLPGWLIQSTIRNTMERLTREGKSLFGLTNMMVDEFTDETGVDTGVSDGNYSSGVYMGVLKETSNAVTPSYGTFSYSDQHGSAPAAGVLDGNSSTYWNANATSGWLQLDFAEPKQFWKYGFRNYNDSRYAITSVVFQYWNGSSWVAVDNRSGIACNDAVHEWELSEMTPATTKIRWSLVGGGSNCFIRELFVYEASVADYVLQSISNTVSASPDAATLLIRCETEGVPGVDFKAFISRDGGTTWTEGVLAKIADEGAVDYYEAVVDVSAQPVGTDLKYKITSHNSKLLTIHAVGLNW